MIDKDGVERYEDGTRDLRALITVLGVGVAVVVYSLFIGIRYMIWGI